MIKFNKHIDALCACTHNAETLNALHACREGHPLGNPFQWRNAWALVSQHWLDFMGINTQWLERQARAEASQPQV